MVRINIEIPDDVHKELKLEAVRKDKALKDFIVEALEKSLKK